MSDVGTKKHLRASDGWLVESRPLGELKEFVCQHHYARSCSNTATERHGLVDPAGVLAGAALWIPPTKNAARTIAADDWRSVLCLSRLAVRPDVPTNGASFLLGRSMRLLDPRWVHALTYADTSEGHTGAIYRATNWVEIGPVPAGDVWVHSVTGQQRGRKRGPRTLLAAEMVEAGYVRKASAPKIKFTKRLQGDCL